MEGLSEEVLFLIIFENRMPSVVVYQRIQTGEYFQSYVEFSILHMHLKIAILWACVHCYRQVARLKKKQITKRRQIAHSTDTHLSYWALTVIRTRKYKILPSDGIHSTLLLPQIKNQFQKLNVSWKDIHSRLLSKKTLKYWRRLKVETIFVDVFIYSHRQSSWDAIISF